MDSLVDLYSFTDISVDSGAPYNIKVDLRSNLAQFRQKLNSGGYTGDYEFQSDLMNTFNLLFDAHTLYRAPLGYRCFFSRPFHLESIYANNTLSYALRLGPLGAPGDELWHTNFGILPSDYVNQVVTSINNKSVTDHVIGVARNFIATYKDESVRFNAALRGRWAQTLLNVFPITDPNFDYDSTYVLADGRTVTIPNVAYCSKAPKSTEDLLSRNQRFSTLSKDMPLSDDPHFLMTGLDIHREHDKMFKDAFAALPAPLKRANTETANKRAKSARTTQSHTINIHDYTGVHAAVGSEFHDVSGFEVPVRQIYANYDVSHLQMVTSVSNDTYFLKYRDGINPPIWIFKLTTFHPASAAATLNVLNTLLTDAEASQGTHLIVDVAYNGGGTICLSDLILALLVPEWRTLHVPHPNGTPVGIYDYKQSKTAIAIRNNPLVDPTYTSYKKYRDIRTEQIATPAIFNGVLRTRAGTTSNYTQQALFPAGCAAYDPLKPNGRYVPYYFKSISVITDGTCGSACALFASQLQSNKKAKIISYGGIPGRTTPLSTASFAGGNVLEYDLLAEYSANAPGLPPIMRSSAAARFNFNEFYEHTDLVTPREFLKRPADYHLDFYATLYASNPWTDNGLASYAALYNAVTHTF